MFVGFFSLYVIQTLQTNLFHEMKVIQSASFQIKILNEVYTNVLIKMMQGHVHK